VAKPKSVYRCSECGAEYAKWAGRCDTCGEWNTLVEEPVAAKAAASGAERRLRGSKGLAEGGSVATATRLRDVTGTEMTRWSSGMQELDFVLGGGVVPGSMVLIGGEPGQGKSTKKMHLSSNDKASGHSTLYYSGEESAYQVRMRADRLGGSSDAVMVAAETNLESILATAAAGAPAALIIDSIQTVFSADLEGAPGNVGQVRECAARLMRFAKETGTAVFVVGHVTKGGGIAGPKTLEHIVDTVLYFEGEGSVDHRILRATKNRFGSVDEIGVFRMTSHGLDPVANPSELFVGERGARTSGSALTALLEGSRPLLVEVQALAAKAGYGTAQRVSTGFDSKRLALLLAVLEKRAGLPFGQLDVFINIVGGIRIGEPSADLAIAAALASTVQDRPLPADSAFIGEIGLGGEVRPVSQTDRRIAEAANMGLRRIYVAKRGATVRTGNGTEVMTVESVSDLFGKVFT
jgi:DNA repair protein RadA/Sms